MRTEIDNRQEYYQRRFEYFGGEVEWIECVPDILNEMIEPIDKLSLAFRYLNKEAKKFTDSVERITQ